MWSWRCPQQGTTYICQYAALVSLGLRLDEEHPLTFINLLPTTNERGNENHKSLCVKVALASTNPRHVGGPHDVFYFVFFCASHTKVCSSTQVYTNVVSVFELIPCFNKDMGMDIKYPAQIVSHRSIPTRERTLDHSHKLICEHEMGLRNMNPCKRCDILSLILIEIRQLYPITMCPCTTLSFSRCGNDKTRQ